MYGSGVTHYVCSNIRFPGRHMDQKYYPQPSFYAVLREEERKGREACVLNPLRHFVLYQAKIVL